MGQVIFPDYSNLVGIPYSEMNCWDISQQFYSQVLGIQLKNYYDECPKDREESQNIIYTNKGDFKKVQVPKFGDIILLRVKGLESHIAVYVGSDKMLHTTRNTGSVIEGIGKWKTLVTGYYRL